MCASRDTCVKTLILRDQKAWFAWLRRNHGASAGVWLRIARKSAKVRSVSYPEAVEAALCFGWIDGQKRKGAEDYWLQRFTPRSARSAWSRINREKAVRLIERGQMKAAGLREVEKPARGPLGPGLRFPARRRGYRLTSRPCSSGFQGQRRSSLRSTSATDTPCCTGSRRRKRPRPDPGGSGNCRDAVTPGKDPRVRFSVSSR